MTSRFAQKADSTVNVRSVLEYVPFFRDKLFVMFIEESLLGSTELVDALLDMDALQEIGVRIVLVAEGHEARPVYGRAVACELRTALVSGDLRDVESRVQAEQVLQRGQIPVIASGGTGIFDPALVAWAVSLRASKYIALVEESRVPKRMGSPIHAIIESGVDTLTEVNERDRLMLVEAAEVCRSGIPRVHILNGRRRGVLVDELFSEEGVGTMVHADSYQEIRALSTEDIPELLSMIGRSVQDAKLIERTYEDILEHIGDYYVLTLDDTIVGSLAVHLYPEQKAAEVACLYIKHRHEGLGYGRALVAFAEQKARAVGMTQVFAISRSAVEFFRDRMMYAEWDRALLPPSRLEELCKSGRDSGVFGRAL